MNRRLYRCSHDQRIAGVASGLAEYLDIDVTLVRVLWILSIFFGGFGLLLYVILAIAIPLEPEPVPGAAMAPGDPAGVGREHAAVASGPSGHRHAGRSDGGPGFGATFVGLALILFGGLALVDLVVPGLPDGRFLWPAFILGIGALLVATSLRRRSSEP